MPSGFHAGAWISRIRTIARNEFYLTSITTFYFLFFTGSRVFLYCYSIKFLEKLENPFHARCSTLLSASIFRFALLIANRYPCPRYMHPRSLFYFLFILYFSLFLTNLYSRYIFPFGSFFLLLLPSKTFDLCLSKFRNFKSIPALFFPSIFSRSRENIYILFPPIHFHGKS